MVIPRAVVRDTTVPKTPHVALSMLMLIMGVVPILAPDDRFAHSLLGWLARDLCRHYPLRNRNAMGPCPKSWLRVWRLQIKSN